MFLTSISTQVMHVWGELLYHATSILLQLYHLLFQYVILRSNMAGKTCGTEERWVGMLIRRWSKLVVFPAADTKLEIGPI